MTQILGIDHVQVSAPRGCEDDARRFYGGLLGLAEIGKPEPLRSRGGVWFRCGAQQLHVGVDDRFTPAEKAHPALLVQSGALDGLAARLQSSGHEVTWDHAIAGLRRFYARDLWGNRLELIEGL